MTKCVNHYAFAVPTLQRSTFNICIKWRWRIIFPPVQVYLYGIFVFKVCMRHDFPFVFHFSSCCPRFVSNLRLVMQGMLGCIMVRLSSTCFPHFPQWDAKRNFDFRFVLRHLDFLKQFFVQQSNSVPVITLVWWDINQNLRCSLRFVVFDKQEGGK